MDELKDKLIAALDGALLPLGMNRTDLSGGATWKLPGEYPLCWNSAGIYSGIELETEREQWSRKPTGKNRLCVGGLRKIDYQALPYRVFKGIDSAESPEFKKALAFAVKRVEAVKLDIAARAVQKERENKELAALRAAVKAANLPNWCWKSAEYDNGTKILRDAPVLVNGELRFEIDERFTLTAESAAQLFAILGEGATLDIHLDKKLTPAQWVEYLQWRQDGKIK